VNLSVKLITALAAFVLLVVGLVGLTSSGSTAHAAVDAKVYVANEWSKLTNDATPLSGYKYAGSGKTVYSTFVEVNSAGGAAQNTIQTLSDRVTIFVEDADANGSVPKSTTVTSGAAFTNVIGASSIVVLTTGESPIIDADGDGNVFDDITITAVPTGSVVISGATAGSSASGGTITLVSTTSAISSGAVLTWNTSKLDTVVVKVTSTQNSTGKTFTITETGASTGVFKGSIDLSDVQNTAAGVGKIEIQNAGILTVTYVDATPAGGGSSKSVTSTATAESAAPLVVLTAPVNGSATQVLRPAFAGSVTDSTAGLDVSKILVFIDESDDVRRGRGLFRAKVGRAQARRVCALVVGLLL